MKKTLNTDDDCTYYDEKSFVLKKYNKASSPATQADASSNTTIDSLLENKAKRKDDASSSNKEDDQTTESSDNNDDSFISIPIESITNIKENSFSPKNQRKGYNVDNPFCCIPENSKYNGNEECVHSCNNQCFGVPFQQQNADIVSSDMSSLQLYPQQHDEYHKQGCTTTTSDTTNAASRTYVPSYSEERSRERTCFPSFASSNSANITSRATSSKKNMMLSNDQTASTNDVLEKNLPNGCLLSVDKEDVNALAGHNDDLKGIKSQEECASCFSLTIVHEKEHHTKDSKHEQQNCWNGQTAALLSSGKRSLLITPTTDKNTDQLQTYHDEVATSSKSEDRSLFLLSGGTGMGRRSNDIDPKEIQSQKDFISSIAPKYDAINELKRDKSTQQCCWGEQTTELIRSAKHPLLVTLVNTDNNYQKKTQEDINYSLGSKERSLMMPSNEEGEEANKSHGTNGTIFESHQKSTSCFPLGCHTGTKVKESVYAEQCCWNRHTATLLSSGQRFVMVTPGKEQQQKDDDESVGINEDLMLLPPEEEKGTKSDLEHYLTTVKNPIKSSNEFGKGGSTSNTITPSHLVGDEESALLPSAANENQDNEGKGTETDVMNLADGLVSDHQQKEKDNENDHVSSLMSPPQPSSIDSDSTDIAHTYNTTTQSIGGVSSKSIAAVSSSHDVVPFDDAMRTDNERSNTKQSKGSFTSAHGAYGTSREDKCDQQYCWNGQPAAMLGTGQQSLLIMPTNTDDDQKQSQQKDDEFTKIKEQSVLLPCKECGRNNSHEVSLKDMESHQQLASCFSSFCHNRNEISKDKNDNQCCWNRQAAALLVSRQPPLLVTPLSNNVRADRARIGVNGEVSSSSEVGGKEQESIQQTPTIQSREDVNDINATTPNKSLPLIKDKGHTVFIEAGTKENNEGTEPETNYTKSADEPASDHDQKEIDNEGGHPPSLMSMHQPPSINFESFVDKAHTNNMPGSRQPPLMVTPLSNNVRADRAQIGVNEDVSISSEVGGKGRESIRQTPTMQLREEIKAGDSITSSHIVADKENSVLDESSWEQDKDEEVTGQNRKKPLKSPDNRKNKSASIESTYDKIIGFIQKITRSKTTDEAERLLDTSVSRSPVYTTSAMVDSCGIDKRHYAPISSFVAIMKDDMKGKPELSGNSDDCSYGAIDKNQSLSSSRGVDASHFLSDTAQAQDENLQLLRASYSERADGKEGTNLKSYIKRADFVGYSSYANSPKSCREESSLDLKHARSKRASLWKEGDDPSDMVFELLSMFATCALFTPILLAFTHGGSTLCGVIGNRKHQLIMAWVPLSSALGGVYGLRCKSLTRRCIKYGHVNEDTYTAYLKKESVVASVLASLAATVLGVMAFLSSGSFEIIFGLSVTIGQFVSISFSGIVGAAVPIWLQFGTPWINLNRRLQRRIAKKFSGTIVTVITDLMTSLVMIYVTLGILMLIPPTIHEGDKCSW